MKQQLLKWISVRFIIVYTFLGILWILLDHFLATRLITNIEPTTIPHLISDVFFLLATGIAVYILLRFWEKKRFIFEEQLRENEERFHQIFQNAPVAYHSLDEDANIMLVNNTWLDLLGYERDEVVGKWFGNLLTKESQPELQKNFSLFLKQGEIRNVEFQMVKKDNSVIYINLTGKIGTDIDGNFKQTHCVFRDVTKEIQISNALQESEEKYRSIINNTMEGIFVIQDRKLVFCNQRFCDILGGESPEQMLDTYFSNYIGSNDKEEFEEYLLEREAGKEQKSLYNFTAIRQDNSDLQLEIFSHLIFYNDRPALQGTFRDITEQVLLRRQLAQSQKMDSIGRLASGVAHDFNNLLTAIIGGAELAKLNMENEVFDHESLDEILSTSKKGAELTRQLLAFSRKDIINPIALNLNETINNLDVLFMRLITEIISLSFDLEPKLWTVKADNSQIEQVLINLVINARDAMPDGGKLSIKTENVTIENQVCLICHESFSGNFVRVCVEDNGIGIEQEQIEIIFEPFYSTKEKHKGTGLGLSTVYGVMKNSGGHIFLESTIGHGSKFHLYFPIVSEPVSELTHPLRPSSLKEGTETILVVEDEVEVRRTTVRSLKQFGYTVFEAESGKKALELVSSLSEMIDLVLSDIVMPEMDGRILMEKIQIVKPEMKAVFMSGYAPSSLEGNKPLPADIPLLKKPFHPKDLALTVRRALDMKSEV